MSSSSISMLPACTAVLSRAVLIVQSALGHSARMDAMLSTHLALFVTRDMCIRVGCHLRHLSFFHLPLVGCRMMNSILKENLKDIKGKTNLVSA